ncbi:MAG: nucleotidyltransferase domain-containing protein [Gemmatimonadota bacterium]
MSPIPLEHAAQPILGARRASATRPSVGQALTAPELAAVRYFVARVLEEIRSPLVQAALFGSKARGEARADSDVDVLLVFRHLPPDREPHASAAERIAMEVAAETRVPVTVWSVSLVDLDVGQRTPMLVDALEDALPIWCWPEPLPSVAFTPPDTARCADALLARVAEGSRDFAEALFRGDLLAARLRGRDDVIRLLTALLLLDGTTRPRRSDVVEAYRVVDPEGAENPPLLADMLAWARASFGADGRCDDLPPPPSPGGERGLAEVVDLLRRRVRVALERLCQEAGLA